LLCKSSRTTRPAEPGLADTPTIATLRGRITALMAEAAEYGWSVARVIVIDGPVTARLGE
jgi:hypothetical protein